MASVSKKTDQQGNKLSRIAALVDKKVSTTSMTQREIATAVGFKNQNMITMIKQGTAKLPLDRVPQMAKVLEVDPAFLFRLALEQFYEPSAVKMLNAVLDAPLSKNERAILNHIRERGNDPELSDKLRSAIDTALSH